MGTGAKRALGAVGAAIPLVVLAVVAANPELDKFWEDDRVHFWLVGGIGVAALAIAPQSSPRS